MGFRPRPGATSHTPSSRWSAKRFRHRITVFRFIESCCAIATSDSPAAAANTIRQRSATCCGVPWAPTHCCIFCRSTAESSHELPMQQHNPKSGQLSSYLLDTTLAINKRDRLPGEGIGWFITKIEDFRKLPRKEQRRLVDLELQKVLQYGKWPSVLSVFGLAPVTVDYSDVLSQ